MCIVKLHKNYIYGLRDYYLMTIGVSQLRAPHYLRDAGFSAWFYVCMVYRYFGLHTRIVEFTCPTIADFKSTSHSSLGHVII